MYAETPWQSQEVQSSPEATQYCLQSRDAFKIDKIKTRSQGSHAPH